MRVIITSKTIMVITLILLIELFQNKIMDNIIVHIDGILGFYPQFLRLVYKKFVL